MHEITAAMIDVCSEINRASLVDFWDNMSPRSDHGTRTTIDSSGRATNSEAMDATIFKVGEMRGEVMERGTHTSLAEFL